MFTIGKLILLLYLYYTLSVRLTVAYFILLLTWVSVIIIVPSINYSTT